MYLSILHWHVSNDVRLPQTATRIPEREPISSQVLVRLLLKKHCWQTILTVSVVTWYVICSYQYFQRVLYVSISEEHLMNIQYDDIMHMKEGTVFLLHIYIILSSVCTRQMNWIISWLLMGSRRNASYCTYGEHTRKRSTPN